MGTTLKHTLLLQLCLSFLIHFVTSSSLTWNLVNGSNQKLCSNNRCILTPGQRVTMAVAWNFTFGDAKDPQLLIKESISLLFNGDKTYYLCSPLNKMSPTVSETKCKYAVELHQGAYTFNIAISAPTLPGNVKERKAEVWLDMGHDTNDRPLNVVTVKK